MPAHTCRWGILSTGWIANKFALDLLIDPATRGVSDVQHQIVAVGSRSVDSAKRFVEETWKGAGVSAGKDQVKLYGSYDQLIADENVDCIYVGTPHSHHYANVYACLSAGKNVLCEKSLTVNAPQASALIDLARSKNLFFMEAVWTRFQPYAYKLQEVIESGAIGQVRAVQAELCADFGPTAKENPDHRLVNPYLAGGALLDLGPYPWTQLALTLLPRSKASSEPLPVPKVAASMTKTSSGVDASVVAAIEFKQEDGRIVQGTFTAAQDRHSIEHRCVLVQGSKGFIEVAFPTYRPRKFTVYRYENEQQMGDLEVQPETDVYQFEPRAGDCWGFVWEADEVARCLRDGKKESDRMPLRETLLMMQVFDEMRKQGSFVYPEQLETLELS